jgi:type IV pilus assembly protein PilX
MNSESPHNRQQGAAMVVALIMLLVLTLLATASARMTILEEMMTGNTQDRNVAFQAAEAALRAGEDVVADPTVDEFDFVDADGLYEAADPDEDPVWETVDWESADVLPWDELEDAPGALPNASAGLIVEQLPLTEPPPDASSAVDDELYYRVTSRGVGVSGNAVVTLQTTFKR